MRKVLITILFIWCAFNTAKGQMISTDPAVPTTVGTIKVFFDASSADAGELRNYSGDLYAHTGVTINGSSWQKVVGAWKDNLAQPKLLSLGNYRYELDITPDIKTFYSLASAAGVTKICLVIRNSDGSKQTRPDIFIDIFQAGLNVTFTLPGRFSMVAELNSLIPVKVAATNYDSISLFINNKYIKKSISPDQLTYTMNANQYGEFWVKAKAWKSPAFVADSFFVFIRGPLVTETLPPGLKDGINYTSNTSVTLVLFAPYKKYVFATGDFTGWLASNKGYMKRTPDNERYWIEINGLKAGKEYRFQYLVDSSLYIADPYADKILDPTNDPYITSDTYPGLISYPKDTTTGIISVLQTGQTPYPWQTTVFDPPKKSNLIIYELLIRDFIAKHDFKTLTDTLSYLDGLGINAIELMPVCEFEGNLSWGYNPTFYFAPDKYYGPKNDMKAFIDSCHKRGIAVIMDIVLNHCMGPSPFVQLYLDHYGSDQIYMKMPNPWFNASSPNPVYKWGADFNHESPATQKLVDRITSYWLTEYKIDGFRFDFTKGFTNTPGEGTAYDASRITILERIAHEIWSVNTNAYVILEHFTQNTEEMELANYGMFLWGNNNYNYCEAAMGYPSDLSSVSWLGRSWSVPNLVSYMESHDEERLMYKTIKYGDFSGSYDTKNLETALNRMKLDALFFITVPGPKMIWQFGELGYDISIESGGRTSEKPIKWDYFKELDRYRLYKFYRLMNALKNTQSVFQTANYSWSLSSTAKRLLLKSTDNKLNILGNFGLAGANINPEFPETGKWYEYFSGDSITVSSISDNLFFQPGEFRLYSLKKLPSSKLLLDVEKDFIPAKEKTVTAYPNPSHKEFNFLIKIENPVPVTLTVFDITGRIIRQIKTETHGNSSEPIIWDGKTATGSDSASGIYFIQLFTRFNTWTLKVIKE